MNKLLEVYSKGLYNSLSNEGVVAVVEHFQNISNDSSVHGLSGLFKNKTVSKEEKLKAAIDLIEGDEDLEAFIQIVESEALTLHAMMQSSHPYYILMRPNTLHIIEVIWAFRAETKIPLCFTLDAGANVHLLYPKQHQTAVDVFISEQLLEYCQDRECLKDSVGWGAKKL